MRSAARSSVNTAALHCRLTSADEIFDAAIWRLAAWSAEQIEAATDELAKLFDAGHELVKGDPTVDAFLQRLRRPDRRDPWSAACALAVFLADTRCDAALFWRAGHAVVHSYRQARRGRHRPAGDALDELIAENLQRNPSATARELFDRFRRLAITGATCVVEADDERLTIEPDPDSTRLLPVSWRAFEVRVSRARMQVSGEQRRISTQVATGLELKTAIAAWHDRSNLQTVTKR